MNLGEIWPPNHLLALLSSDLWDERRLFVCNEAKECLFEVLQLSMPTGVGREEVQVSFQHVLASAFQPHGPLLIHEAEESWGNDFSEEGDVPVMKDSVGLRADEVISALGVEDKVTIDVEWQLGLRLK